MLQAGNTAEPMASGVYEFEECSWRMLLYVRYYYYSCTEPFILYELHSGKSYYPLDYGLVTLAKPYTYKVNLYKLSTFYKMNRLNQNNACLVTLIGHI